MARHLRSLGRRIDSSCSTESATNRNRTPYPKAPTPFVNAALASSGYRVGIGSHRLTSHSSHDDSAQRADEAAAPAAQDGAAAGELVADLTRKLMPTLTPILTTVTPHAVRETC